MNLNGRRKFHRINFDGQVNLKFANHVYDCCKIKDLSLTGMFVIGNFKQQHRKDCFVKIFHKEKDGNNCLNAFCEVVWVNADGIGLKFSSMTFENYLLLQTTLSNKAELPEVILREFSDNSPFEINYF